MTRALPLFALTSALLLPGVAAADAHACTPQPGAWTDSDACADQAPESHATDEAANGPADALGLGCKRWSIGAMAAGMRDDARGGFEHAGFGHGRTVASACAVRELYAGRRPPPGNAPLA